MPHWCEVEGVLYHTVLGDGNVKSADVCLCGVVAGSGGGGGGRGARSVLHYSDWQVRQDWLEVQTQVSSRSFVRKW